MAKNRDARAAPKRRNTCAPSRNRITFRRVLELRRPPPPGGVRACHGGFSMARRSIRGLRLLGCTGDLGRISRLQGGPDGAGPCRTTETSAAGRHQRRASQRGRVRAPHPAQSGGYVTRNRVWRRGWRPSRTRLSRSAPSCSKAARRQAERGSPESEVDRVVALCLERGFVR